MKKHFKQLFLIIPLVFIAGATFAAYSFIGPATTTSTPTCTSGNGTPPNCNTDAPLDISATDQVKNGGLAVDTFHSRTGSDFAQQTAFTGLVRGGTSTDTNSTIPFGTSSKQVSVNNVGNTTVTGNYQSDSLKTGGGSKPLCADNTGTFYICGTTVPTNNIQPVYVGIYPATTYSNGSTTNQVMATLSETLNIPVSATISAKSYYAISGCSYTTTAQNIGTVIIPAEATTSTSGVPIPSGCNINATDFEVSAVSPSVTQGGRPIVKY